MKVYISGKIGEEALSEATRGKFAKAEKMLKAEGFDVFNPTVSGLGKCAEEAAKKYGTTFYMEILIYDLMALKSCDAIYMLPDWMDSPGATVELHYAMATGKKVLFAGAIHAWDYLSERFARQNGVFTERARNEYIDSHMGETWIPL